MEADTRTSVLDILRDQFCAPAFRFGLINPIRLLPVLAGYETELRIVSREDGHAPEKH